MVKIQLSFKPVVILILSGLLQFSCSRESSLVPPTNDPYIIVLGTSQDGGYPQAGCNKSCCRNAWDNPSLRRLVSCIAVVDPASSEQWIIDATPDFREQLHIISTITGLHGSNTISGIILTHAHVGHYTGLIHLGREVMGTNAIPVYAMPGMQQFLKTNGPWSQLIELKNIEIKPMISDSVIHLNERISFTPILVPHRDEYAETVGIIIECMDDKALYIPDIDKWSDWDVDICELIEKVDIAFLDGTFYMNGEIPGRDMSEIPHPFIEESMKKFSILNSEDKSKIHFIHFNHTNPVLDNNSLAKRTVLEAGFKLAEEQQIVVF